MRDLNSPHVVLLYRNTNNFRSPTILLKLGEYFYMIKVLIDQAHEITPNERKSYSDNN